MGFRNGSKPGNEVMDEAKNGFRHSEANIPSFSAELQKEATHAVLELRADGSTSPLENLSSRRLYTYIKHVVSAFADLDLGSVLGGANVAKGNFVLPTDHDSPKVAKPTGASNGD